jgi:DivIVA domain-containing protein
VSWSTNGGQVPHGRPITPSEIRSVVFTTTRMRLGYDVAEVDSFLDQIEWSMETMIAEINRLQRQISDIDRAHAASLDDARVAAEQLLMRLGGPTAAAASAGGFRAVGAMPTGPAPQPRRAAATPPPGWSPSPTSPVGQPGGPAPMPRALPSPPPRGRPAANLPPPPQYQGFPPPRG